MQGKGTYGLGLEISTFKAKYIKLENKMIGGNIFYESFAFNDKVQYRIEFSHSIRSKDTLPFTANIKSYSDLRLLYGNTFNKNNRIQFPFFVGPGYNWTKGSWTLKGFSLGFKAGARLYITNKIGIFGELNGNIMLDPDVGIRYSNGNDETKDIWANKYGLNLGILFNNF